MWHRKFAPLYMRAVRALNGPFPCRTLILERNHERIAGDGIGAAFEEGPHQGAHPDWSSGGICDMLAATTARAPRGESATTRRMPLPCWSHSAAPRASAVRPASTMPGVKTLLK